MEEKVKLFMKGIMCSDEIRWQKIGESIQRKKNNEIIIKKDNRSH